MTHWKLPRGEVFSPFYQNHLDEAHALFNVFYFAKDYQTFWNTAVWARFHVNEQLFNYAFICAVIHRPDTQAIKIPPLYELMPHYFFNNEVMQQAYRIKMGDTSKRLASALFFPQFITQIRISFNRISSHRVLLKKI